MRRLLSNLAPRVFSRFSNLLAVNQEKRVFSSLPPPYCDTRRPWGRGHSVSTVLSYHPFLGRNLCFKNAFCQLISTRLNPFLAFLLFIVEHSGEKQKRKTKELTKGTWHATCTFLHLWQNLFFLYHQFTNRSPGLPFKIALQFSAFMGRLAIL